MDVFGGIAPGTISAASTSGALGTVTFSSDLVPNSVIVTGVGYSGRSALQIMHTLGFATYFYPFGIRDEVLVITGIVFSRACDSMADQANAMPALIARFRGAAALGRVVTLTAGDSYRGMVDSLRTSWVDHTVGTLGFELRVHLFSDNAMVDATRSGGSSGGFSGGRSGGGGASRGW